MRLSWTCLLAVAGGVNGIPAQSSDGSYDFGYDKTAYGPHPLTIFKSAAQLEVPKLNVLQSSSACESSLYTLLTPRGGATREAQATIFDTNGDLVWTSGWRGQQLYNLMVQEYRGEKYLTFWAGNDAVGGHGAGTVIMLDKTYTLFKEIKAANGLDADLHDFRITKAGTALITVYEIVQRDLSGVGKDHHGPVWDCLIQEVDLETGQAIFQWRALDHWDLADGYKEIGGDGVGSRAYDVFHMNSIDKDERGNYLTSSRYMHALTYVNGTTGEVIWILGGKRNMFRDLSGGRATNFAYQHDARWAGNDTISMFDNGVDDGHRDIADTRGLKVKIDEENMTVTLVAEYLNPHRIHGVSQGSFQSLPNGNVLLGYGNSAAFTEYASNGEALCDTHFGPESRFGTAEVQSYRVYKYGWQGWPQTTPVTAIRRNSSRHWNLYVSWNGATEVNKWILQGTNTVNATDEDWKELNRTNRIGFETAFPLRKTFPRYLRTVAMHSEGHMLGASNSVDVDEDMLLSSYGSNYIEEDSWTPHFAQAAMVISGAVVVGILAKLIVAAWNNRPTMYWRLPTVPN